MAFASLRPRARTRLTEALLGVALVLFLNAAGVCATSGRNGTLQKSTCNQPDCLRCDLETAECVKCLYVIMADTRECRSACPPGHATTWATHHALMGRVCTERSVLALVSGRDVTIIAGAAVGGAVCVGVVIGALLYMRRRTKPPPDNPRVDYRHHRYPIPRLWRDKRPKATEVSVADEERAEKNLAPVTAGFPSVRRAVVRDLSRVLTLLNRREEHIVTVPGTGGGSCRGRRGCWPGTSGRRRRRGVRGRRGARREKPRPSNGRLPLRSQAVVRDLSRVLTLLNRREEHIVTVPGDWRRLSWAARVLARYKRQKAAKEAGDITALEPLATGNAVPDPTPGPGRAMSAGGAGGQCSAPFQDPTHARVTEVHPPAYRDQALTQVFFSSRNDSMQPAELSLGVADSLTHILEEEEEYEAADNHDDVLFSENEEQEHEDAKLTPSEDDLTVADKSLEKQNSPDADYGVVNEKLLTESKFNSNTARDGAVLIQTKENIAQDQEKKHAFNNNDMQTKENIAPTHKAITDLQTLYKEKINTTLTGETCTSTSSEACGDGAPPRRRPLPRRHHRERGGARAEAPRAEERPAALVQDPDEPPAAASQVRADDRVVTEASEKYAFGSGVSD
ncbi:hypothetical protein C7M84_015286 [Penaeus vannamei]|uniref:Uncharacterized protein n=1 Tax=Penaeus vannamei TaxID=6689 RepID=A0A3R7SM50_PENVA|nr:hypothetical protein C7M84_015286 [Penaeus vannamei]